MWGEWFFLLSCDYPLHRGWGREWGGRRRKDTITALLAQMRELLFQWHDGVVTPLGIRRLGTSPGSTTNLAI